MDSKVWIELVGYFGSVLVVVSMLMTSVKKLRLVNTAGSLIFTIYALIIRSYPTAILNFSLVLINIIRIRQLRKTEREFALIREPADSQIVTFFLEYYGDDIRNYFPDVDKSRITDRVSAYMVLCEGAPSGLMLGDETEDGTVNVLMDYATPAYRDWSVGNFLFRRLREYGAKKLILANASPKHLDYLEKSGFEKTEEGYVKYL